MDAETPGKAIELGLGRIDAGLPIAGQNAWQEKILNLEVTLPRDQPVAEASEIRDHQGRADLDGLHQNTCFP
ncbi:hypothetical protein [Roseicyclus sp.]|uniref:hypothetical protein n=1 Tax=Roseicyclus sp. TaxID=1914329 RepID=UPI003F6B9BDB